jgi:hypothetical protein
VGYVWNGLRQWDPVAGYAVITRILARQQAGAARHAQRVVNIKAEQIRSLASQGVEIGSLHEAVAIYPQAVEPLLVGGEKKNIGTGTWYERSHFEYDPSAIDELMLSDGTYTEF